MEWRDPWKPVPNGETAQKLQSELLNELAPGHPLFGRTVAAIGFRGDSDDVVLKITDGSSRFAIVHLTWRMRPEEPPFPNAVIFADEQDLLTRGMQSDQEAP